MTSRVHVEWGPTGGRTAAADADIAVVVDVLSFTTTVCVAVDRGLTVYPYPWRDNHAGAYAAERDAVVAVGRSAARDQGGLSLSPAAMAAAEPGEALGRVVLPSPNGSSICFALIEAGVTVVGASLRNHHAVAAWLAPRVADGGRVVVVAAGERWPDGSLRPAAEDLWGAGAVVASLSPAPAVSSPEARLAAHAFAAVEERLETELAGCVSGRELIEAGFGDDVRMAADVGRSQVVPVLTGDHFSAG